MKRHQQYLLVAIIILAVFIIAAYVVTQQTGATAPSNSDCPSGCCTSNSQANIGFESLRPEQSAIIINT